MNDPEKILKLLQTLKEVSIAGDILIVMFFEFFD